MSTGQGNGGTDMNKIAGKLFGVIGKVEHVFCKPGQCMEAEQFSAQYALYFTAIGRPVHRP